MRSRVMARALATAASGRVRGGVRRAGARAGTAAASATPRARVDAAAAVVRSSLLAQVVVHGHRTLVVRVCLGYVPFASAQYCEACECVHNVLVLLAETSHENAQCAQQDRLGLGPCGSLHPVDASHVTKCDG